MTVNVLRAFVICYFDMGTVGRGFSSTAGVAKSAWRRIQPNDACKYGRHDSALGG